jgi:D-alanyl-D-alanine carboxypeptidase
MNRIYMIRKYIMKNKGLWVCLLYVLLTFSAFASPAPDTGSSDYDLVQAGSPSEPQVLARVEVPENLQSLHLPVYAGLVDGSGVFYALVMTSRTQLDTSGVSYQVIDTCPSDMRYLLAFSATPDHHEKAALQIPVLYDDGRCIIVRNIDDADEFLTDIGFELKLLNAEPMRLYPVEIDKALAEGAVTPISDVTTMLGQVDIDAVTSTLSQLSGASPATIDGTPYTITTRRTDSGTPIEKSVQYIIDHLKKDGLTVSTHDWALENYSGRNIIAELKGKTNSGEIVIMVAHLDSISNKVLAPGADDDASGCAALLAAADIMRKYSFQRTIRFLFTTGEEQGLLGSQVYVKDIDGQKIVAVLNLDMTGYSTSGLTPPVQNIKTRNTKDPGNPADMVIANLYKDVVTTYGLNTTLNVKIRQDSDSSSDQSSFWDKSIPAAWAIEDDYDNYNKDNYHTENDKLSTLNMPYCTAVVKASLATVAHIAGVIGQSSLEAELQKMLDNAITTSKTKTPGAVLLVSTSSTRYVVAGGQSILSSATAMKAADMLRIASMTKSFVSTVILKLREEGKLNLDDTVAKHLPETAAKIANGQTATIRQLLNMSSGIFEYYDNPDYLKAVETRPSRQAWTPEEVIAYVYGQSAYFSPGTQFKYTNSNYILLEMIVNKVSNATLASEMRRIIFTPLGMDNTFMEMAETRAGGFGGLLVRGYDTTQNPAADITEKNDSLGLGDGGLISDAQGLDTFLRALFKQKTLLNEDSLSLMKTIGISGKEYGLGLEVKISSDYGTNWGHSGKTAGFQGEMRYFPDKDTTFAILTNEENSDSTFIDDVFKSSMRLLYPQNSPVRFLGAWPDGVWYWNQSTKQWTKIPSTANAMMIAAGKVDADNTDDLIGVWSSGLYVRQSSDGQWVKLSENLPTWIAAGDLNNDGRDDVIGSWNSDGVYYRDSATGKWWKLATPAKQLTAGNIGGTRDDLVGVWNDGLWVRFSANASWQNIDPAIPIRITAGDMTGDKRAGIVGSYSSGTWYRNSATGAWSKITTPAEQVAAGDIDGDGRDDLIGVWSTGVWVRYGATNLWERITASGPGWITTGRIAETTQAAGSWDDEPFEIE